MSERERFPQAMVRPQSTGDAQVDFENMPIDEQFFAGFDKQTLKIRNPWPREAADRVNDLLGQLAVKELECQRLRESERNLATMLEDCAERLAWVSGANGEHTISQRCLKVAALALARSGQAASGSSQGARSDRTRSQKLADAGFTRRPSLWAMQARETLELIAAPQRPDGSWNRDREACRQLAAEALGRDTDSDVQNGVGQSEAPTAARLPKGWDVIRKDDPLKTIIVIAPNGYSAVTTAVSRNPENVLRMLVEAIAAHPPARSGAGSEEGGQG